MRKCKNWIQCYLDWTDPTETPALFHFWGAVGAISASVGRNVWLPRGNAYRIFPNHYIVIVAPSARCRKAMAVDLAKRVMTKAGKINVMDERLTAATLLQRMHECTIQTGKSEVLLWADELSIFLSKEESYRAIIPLLTRCYTCPNELPSGTISRGKAEPKNICINTLFATTPTDLEELIPDSATGTGFTPRLHLVYQADRKRKNPEPTLDEELEAKLIHDLTEIRKLNGPFTKTEDAQRWWEQWYEALNFPDDPVLDGLYGRKHDFMFRLGMVLSLAERDDLVLTKDNLREAAGFLDKLEEFTKQAYKNIGRSQSTQHFDKILKQVSRRGGKASKSELLHDNWSRLNKKELEEVLDSLIAAGEIKESVEGRTTLYYLTRKEASRENDSSNESPRIKEE